MEYHLEAGCVPRRIGKQIIDWLSNVFDHEILQMFALEIEEK